MKKILSVMACMTLVTCSGVMFAACGEKKDPPKASFTVANDVAVKAAAIVDELQSKVYNAEALGTDHADYDYDDVKNVLADDADVTLTKNYWVDAGKLANLNANSITIGGVEYNKTSKFKLSIGNNNFIEDLVYKIDNKGNVQIAGPVVAFELRNPSSKIKFNNKQFNFLTGDTGVEELNFKDGEFVNVTMNTAHPDDGVVTNVATKTSDNSYNLQLNTSDDAFVLGLPDDRDLDKNGKFLVRTKTDGELESFGITEVEENEEDKGLGIFFGRKADNSVDPAVDGTTKTYDVYYTEGEGAEAKRSATTVDFNLKVTDLAVENEVAKNAKDSIDLLNEKVYNKIEGTANGTELTFDALKERNEVSDYNGEYYIPVGTFKTAVTSIEVDGNEYANDADFSLSIGKNTRIKDKAFKYDSATKTLSIASPILAFRPYTLDTIKVNDEEYDFLQAAQVGTLALTKGKVLAADAKNTIKNTNANEFSLELRNTQEAFAFTPETELTEGYFLTRTGKNFGLTQAEDGGYSSYFGYNNSGVPDDKFDGQRTVSLYYVNGDEIKSADLVLNIEVIHGNAQLQAKYEEATNVDGNKLIELDKKVELTEAFTIDKEVTIDLKGYTIDSNFTGIDTMFEIVNGGKLTIKDSSNEKTGKITASGEDGYVFRVNDTSYAANGEDANLTIENGYFETKSASVVSITKGKAVVKGGTFKSTYSDPAYEGRDFTLNCINAASTDGTAVIEVVGGKFWKFNPSDLTNDDAHDSYLPVGLKTQAVDTEWNEVVAETEDVEVLNETDLRNAVKYVAAGTTIKLSGEVTLTGTTGITIDKQLTIDLNGKKLKETIAYVENETTEAMFEIVSGGDLTFTDSSAEHTGEVESDDLWAFWVKGTSKTDAKLTIENGKFTMDAPASTSDVAYVTGGTVIVKDGTFACHRAKFTFNRNDDLKDVCEFEIMGGKFKNYDPKLSPSEDPRESFLADGYTTQEDSTSDNPNIWYTVVEQN